MSMKLSTIPQHFSPEIEDRLGYLNQFDTVFLIDDSTSMTTLDKVAKPSRWNEAKEMLAVLAQIAARHDEDGIDVHFLNSKNVYRNLTTVNEVARVFQEVRPEGGTPTATKLDKILEEYVKELRASRTQKKRSSWFGLKSQNQNQKKPVKPLNLIVITDGRPFPASEEPDEVIRKYMLELDQLGISKRKRQIGIMFAQVGHDQKATEHLQELDDMATGNERDMVDTFKCNLSDVADEDIDTLAKLLLGAIVPEIDELMKATPVTGSSKKGRLANSSLVAPPAYDVGSSNMSSVPSSSQAEKKTGF